MLSAAPRFRPVAKIAFAAVALVLLLGVLGVFTGFFGPVRSLRKVRHDGEDCFTSNPDFARLHLKNETVPPSPHVWVQAKKREATRRVVLIGGSVAAGFPVPFFHLGRLVEALWRARFPNEPVEVVNLSMDGADSRALHVFADDAMELDPDMVVLCADEYGQYDGEAGLRDIVRRALRHDIKVLFLPPLDGRDLAQTIAAESGRAVAVVDITGWWPGPDATTVTGREFFLDGIHPDFTGRIALAGLIVDGMAGLWGLAQPDGSPASAAAWRQNLSAVENEARRDVFFTPFDEYDMWSLALKESDSGRRPVARLSPERRAVIAEKVRDLQRRARLEWDTTDVIVGYERAQLQNPLDPMTHFTAGRLLGLRGEGVRAEEAFRRGFALQPNNPAALLDYAAMQLKRGDTDAARTSLDMLAEYDPQAAGLLKARAALALREAELPAAADLLRQHLARDPNDADSWFTLSEIQLKLGDFSGSETSRNRGKAVETKKIGQFFGGRGSVP